jgi:type I restriction enzyme S subunit
MNSIPLGNNSREQVPDEWNLLSLRRVIVQGPDGIKIGPFGSQLRLEFMEDDGRYKVYGQENVISGNFSAGGRYIGDQKFNELASCEIKPGDIVITMMGTAGRCAVVPSSAQPGIMDSHLLRIRGKPALLIPRFVALLIDQASYVKYQLLQASKGSIMQGLNSSVLKDIVLAIPTLSEQCAIVEYVDRETRRFDALVAKKSELVEKLKEKRSALISRTVTRGLPPEAARAAGLDPHPKFKASGIEWLGDVPAHWGLLPFKRLCARVDVGIAEAATHAYCDDGVPIIRSTNVRPNVLDTSDILKIEPWFAEKNRSKTLRAGDLVTVRTGYPGTTAMIPSEYDGSQCFTLVMSRLKRKEVPRFFAYFFNADPGNTYFQMEGWGTAQTNISVPIVQHIPVVRPPVSEQAAIVDFLDRETARIDRMVAKVEEAIERLQEYRTALITAAVTGKIDVRGQNSERPGGQSGRHGQTEGTREPVRRGGLP